MTADLPTVVILTPVKNAAAHIDTFTAALKTLTFPRDRLSLGILESDSRDGTFDLLADRRAELERDFSSVGIWKRDFGIHTPENVARWATGYQYIRRCTLARARNSLLFNALAANDWVLWLDVDIIEYPPDIIEQLLATELEIVQPHCVTRYGGPSFDRNAWRRKGTVHMDDLRGGDDVVRLDAVGGTMLLVKGDLHRDGLVFPAYPFGRRADTVRDTNDWLPDGGCGECETEGLGIMAREMGKQCWGMPNLEILHIDE